METEELLNACLAAKQDQYMLLRNLYILLIYVGQDLDL